MTALYDFDTLLQFAAEVVASETRQERRRVLERFNPLEHEDRYGTHPQCMLLTKMCRAIKDNGSWEAVPAFVKQLIKEDFSKPHHPFF